MSAETLVPLGSWWTDPALQKDRAAFNRVMLARVPAMQVSQGAQLADRLATANWTAGVEIKRRLTSTWMPWSA